MTPPDRATALSVMARPARVVVVAGMHRAGTSVVARGLQVLGVELGEHLMSADVRMNARGFFEDVDIVKLDDALLDALCGDWKNLAPFDRIDWSDRAFAPLHAQACELMLRRLARSPLYGFKDPRVPRLLPFWQRVFAEIDCAHSYVIAVRNPLSVIESLTARDGLDARRSGWLWLTHLLCALRYTAGRPRVVVDYDRLLEAPKRELGRIAEALELPGASIPSPAADAYARDFLSLELRHAMHAVDDVDAMAAMPLMRDAHALAQRLARDANANSAASTGEIDQLLARFSALSPLLTYAGSVERAADDVPRLGGELEWARQSLARATEFNADLERAKRELERSLHIAQEYNSDLLAALARKESELVAAHTRLARVGERLLGRIMLRDIDRAS